MTYNCTCADPTRPEYTCKEHSEAGYIYYYREKCKTLEAQVEKLEEHIRKISDIPPGYLPEEYNQIIDEAVAATGGRN